MLVISRTKCSLLPNPIAGKTYEPSHDKINNLGFLPGLLNTNWPVQSQNQARSLKFQI